MSDKKLTLKGSGPGNFEPILINTKASPTVDGVTSITNGEIGIDDTGLLIFGNKATSLYKILNELLIGLATCAGTLAANSVTEPAAAATGVALGTTVAAVQSQINLLLSAK